MKLRLTLVAASIAAISGSAFAADVDLSKLPPPADKKGVTYAADIQPIFKASCFGCHGENRPKAGLRLDSLEAALKGSKDGQVITAGKSEKSALVIAVARLDPKKAMPPAPRNPRMRSPGSPAGEAGTNAPNTAARAGGGPPPSGPDGPPPGGPGPGGPGGPPGGRGFGGPPAKPLTPEQVGLVRAWIDQGAK